MRKKLTLLASLAFAAALSAGVAGASISAQADTDWANFQIKEASVRLGNGTKENPTGLRFKIDCPVDLRAEEGAEYYTTISFTADKPYTTNVPATHWRADASGWNTLLLEIPSQYYTMDVTATAVVKLDGETYTATATSSIAKTASIVMNGGQKDAKLDAFVAGAVTDITLSEATATLQEGETVQLTATTAPAGYGVVWASDAEEVATVAPDGTITAVSAGTANITATMSGVTKTCVVTVKGRTLYDFESAEQVALAEKLLGCGGGGNVATWAIAENVGAAGNNALQKTDTGYSTGMQLRMNTAYLKGLFEKANYISFDVYTDIDSLVSLRIDANGGANEYLYGKGATATSGGANILGASVDAFAGTALYKYTFAIPKARFNVAVAEEAPNEDTVIRFSCPVKPAIWFLDNFNVEGNYDANTIDFADGLASGAILPDWQGNTGHAQVVERVEGDYALAVKSSGTAPNFYMDVNYFIYVFHTLNAQSIQYTIYGSGFTGVQDAAFRISLNASTSARNTTGITKTVDVANGTATVTVSRAAYEQWFENGVYKNNASGVARVDYIELWSNFYNAANMFYVDNIQINR